MHSMCVIVGNFDNAVIHSGESRTTSRWSYLHASPVAPRTFTSAVLVKSVSTHLYNRPPSSWCSEKSFIWKIVLRRKLAHNRYFRIHMSESDDCYQYKCNINWIWNDRIIKCIKKYTLLIHKVHFKALNNLSGCELSA